MAKPLTRLIGSAADVRKRFSFFKPERSFIALALIYGVGIGLLTLALPISIQTLLNTVINTGLPQFIITLSIMLFVLLLFYGGLMACRDYAMDLFQRSLITRMNTEATMRLTHARRSDMDAMNRIELVNRFFEVVPLQKGIPALLSEGFFILLQGVVGIIIVSFYHPFLFFYNLLFVGLLCLIWMIWAKAGFYKAIKLSDSKYGIVRWLEEIARGNHIFKSERSIEYATKRSNANANQYVENHKDFFKTIFAQEIAFLLLYCFACTGLLGLGGILVIQNQLSIGQLIGAEIIMLTVFANVPKLSYYCRIIYDSYASLGKLHYFFRLPLEDDIEGTRLDKKQSALSVHFKDAMFSFRNKTHHLDLEIEAGCKILASAQEQGGSRLFLDLLKRHKGLEKGDLLINGCEISEYDIHNLRNHILFVDSFLVIEGTLRDFFALQAPNATTTEIKEALDIVGLTQVIKDIDGDMDTFIFPSGFPLMEDEIIRLKVAALLLQEPSMIVITEVFDYIPAEIRENILRYLCALKDVTVICFTKLETWDFFDGYLLLDDQQSCLYKDKDQFINHYHAVAKEM